MFIHQFFFLTATCLLHACSSYDTSDPNIKCFPGNQPGRANCKSAYGKIIYESDSTLDVNEGHVEKISGNCAVMVDKPYDLKLTRQTIEDGFAKMLSHCADYSGSYTLPDFKDVKLSTRGRVPYPGIEQDTPSDKLICHPVTKNRSAPEDCIDAYDAIPTNADGEFLFEGSTCTSVYNTVKSCTVAIMSSDESVMLVTKKDMNKIIYRMVSTCDGKWSGIALKGGNLVCMLLLGHEIYVVLHSPLAGWEDPDMDSGRIPIQTNGTNPHELGREGLSDREKIKLYELEIEKLQASLGTSNYKLKKQSLLIRALHIQALGKAIPRLSAVRPVHKWQDRRNRDELGGADFRVERALLPRLRRRILEMTSVLEPSRFEEGIFSEHLETEVGWLDQIDAESCQVKSSVLIPRSEWKSYHLRGVPETMRHQELLRFKQGGRSPYILERYYYPEISWGADLIRDGLIRLYESHIETLQAAEPQSVSLKGTSLGDLLGLIDQMIWNLDHPRKVLQAKWQRVVREIEIMELAIIQFQKPEESRTDLNVEGIDHNIHLKSQYWIPRDEVEDYEIAFLQSYLPLLRVCRVLVNKLSSSASSTPLMAFYDDLNKLNRLYSDTEEMEDQLRKLTLLVLQLRSRRARIRSKDHLGLFRWLHSKIQTHLNSLNCGTDQTQIQKAREWCLMWEVQYDTALANFLDGELSESDGEEDDGSEATDSPFYGDDSTDEEEYDDDEDGW
ncbi:uncharacterized protein PGTG_22308 [Puccinia graminis f. sp. tritici CRL 75-36-700-3]|uniref:Uncharacterized protein n=1 Tax=Puccinia graminis f. sp. tritici (strain CRL 75-36-700-3 / race SCCL) TaxID=418459 RepID=H6QU28_PUCGT|nr:uncharacterized protein PGTG_22308 [Puccinia graminis f. sp. tritici CRL 75-36-700-3]EHS64437.1 hypothetical protein PGTG_22308 [Puccinia graminis f. sp. tritici CRL 75-36-700-3]